MLKKRCVGLTVSILISKCSVFLSSGTVFV